MPATVLLGQRLRRQIRSKVWPLLEGVGFVEFAPLRAHRVSERTIDVVEFVSWASEWREPRWLGGNLYANAATFSLHVGTYYRDIERLPWVEARETHPRAEDCHRCSMLAHGSADSECDGRTFWPGPKGERLDEVMQEAIAALCSRGIGYLDQYRNVDAWIADFERGEARHPGDEEGPELNPEECAAAMRVAREGRAARCEALERLHTRMHLADDHLTSATPCGDVLAALMLARGQIDAALLCLDEAKQAQLRQMTA